MIRNFKALGLALVAVLAMSAVVASAASAANFTSSAATTILTSDNASHGSHVFSAGGLNIICAEAKFTGTVTGTSTTTITVRPTYPERLADGKKNCKFGNLEATVHTTGCTYKFESHTNGTGHLPTRIDCTPGSEITVTAPGCTLHFGSQLTTGGTKATNIAGPPSDVTVEATAGATFGKTDTGTCFLISGNTGTYSGGATLRGYAHGSISGDLHGSYTVQEGAQVSISWD